MTETLATESGQTAAGHWTAVAAAWDAHVDNVDDHSAAVTAALFSHLAIRPGDRVLELACGPGSLGANLSTLAGSAGQVVLSDVAPGMVDVAARRTADFDNVACDVLDAAAIDRPDASFDVVTSRMGLMFTLDPAAAFAEIHRVLDVGGRMGALTWAGIEHNPWMTCVGMAAMMHGIATGGPPIGPGGIFSLGEHAVLESLATDAGFTDVVVEVHDITFHAASVDEHIERVSALAGALAELLNNATAEQRAAICETAADLMTPHRSVDGAVAIPGRALLVSGRR